LTTAPAPDPSPPARKQRRSFTDAEKRAIVVETEQPGATVSQVARAHGIVTSVLFCSRVEFGFGKSKAANLDAWRIAGNGKSDASVEVMARYAALTSARRDRQEVAEWGADVRSERQTFAPRLQADRLLHRRSANAQMGGT
jgi:transposase-like protein